MCENVGLLVHDMPFLTAHQNGAKNIKDVHTLTQWSHSWEENEIDEKLNACYS